MKIDPRQFEVPAGTKVKLKRWPTRIEPIYRSKEHYEQLLAAQVQELGEQQGLLYASGQHALLVVFQAMDAAGKDGAIKHVLSGINPQGCQVHSFKQPSVAELGHDFLWRTTRCLPARGQIGVFNRSYYEEVVVVRVHEDLLDAQNLPGRSSEDKHFWPHRYKSIVDLEQHLTRNGTRILKFFLHLSKEEQRKRLLARIDDPKKNWKMGDADVAERQYWDDYMRAYEACLTATSKGKARWHVVPADDKATARLIVASTMVEALRSLKMHYPKTTSDRQAQLQAVRERLVGETE